MSGLILIQAVWYSDGRFFYWKVNFEKNQQAKKHAKLPGMQSVKEKNKIVKKHFLLVE